MGISKISKISGLKDVREKLLGYKLGSIAHLTGIKMARLQALEASESPPSVFEAEELGRVYGIDADLLAERPIRLSSNDVIQVFTNLDEFRDVGDFEKVRIIEAANATRDLHELQLLAGQQPGHPLFRIPYGSNAPPYQQRAEIAVKLRSRLGLEPGPISSMRDLFRECLPTVTLLYACLGRQGPAALALADAHRPATIVLNLEGKNENPCVRRFSLAHELCHLVADWKPRQPLAILSGYYSDTALAIEQRANAFAVRFLCPQSELTNLPSNASDAATQMMRRYGLHYSAARLYLRNERNETLPDQAFDETTVSASIDHRWEEAEAPHGIFDFPLSSVPPERRTRVAVLAAYLYSRAQIQRDRFAELLRLTPTDELEKVLDFFDLNPPESAADAGSETNLS